MNPDEKAVIVKLVEAWQLYLKLDDHESLDDKDFTRGMNRCQAVIACRVARRVDPELWK